MIALTLVRFRTLLCHHPPPSVAGVTFASYAPRTIFSLPHNLEMNQYKRFVILLAC